MSRDTTVIPFRQLEAIDDRSHANHSQAHQQTRPLVSPFEEATIVSVDGFGDR
jgi:predicted NodU family carbamoyl transferase